MQSLWGKKRRRRELREDKRRAVNDRKRKICELKLMQLPNSNRCHHGDKASDFINFFLFPFVVSSGTLLNTFKAF